MRSRYLLLVGLLATHFGCGSRTDLPVVAEKAFSTDAGGEVAPKQVDRCAAYTTLSDCVRAGCDFYECVTEPVDADVMPTTVACGPVNGPVPAACR